MVSDGCVFQPMVVDLLLNPRHIRHSRLSSRCPLCKRNSERNPPSMTPTIDYWFMWRCTFFKIWTVSNTSAASACATKSPCWSSLPHPRRCALVGSWWSFMALSRTTSSTPGCMSNGWLWIQSFALAIAFQCRPVSSRWFSTFNRWLALFTLYCYLVRNIDLCQGCCVSWSCCSSQGVVSWLWRCSCLSCRKECTLNQVTMKVLMEGRYVFIACLRAMTP